jgi:perosamine synthetase
VLYIPVHLQPWYRRTFGYGPGKCPIAEEFYTRALSLPLYPAMTDEDVARVIDVTLSLSGGPPCFMSDLSLNNETAAT